MTHPTLAAWHEIARTRDVARLDALLDDDAVFQSPVVHRPQAGRALVRMYLAAAFDVFLDDSFQYVREVVAGNDAVLEFRVAIDGIEVNGVDMIRWNDEGRIVDFKVMIRPLKAIEVVHRRMAERLQAGQKAG
jgi:ketosteroid isomerase-like protein